MKNKIIEILARKGEYPNTIAGKVRFLYELTERSRNIGFKRFIKNKCVDDLMGSTRFERGRVYSTKSFFGFKYVSFDNCEVHYQEALIKLCRYNINLANSNGLIDSDLGYEFHLQMQRLQSSLREAKSQETQNAELNW